MKKGNVIALGAFLLALPLLVACGEDDEATTIDEWQGATPHFEAIGNLNGEDLDMVMDGDTYDLTQLRCIREYEVPLLEGTTDYDWENGEMVEIKINVVVSVDDELRNIELELKQHDFQSGSKNLTIIPRTEDAVPAADELFLEWEWYEGDDFEADLDAYFEEAAQSGTVVVELYDGDYADNGLTMENNTGSVGVYIDAQWSETESVVISATAMCGENKIEVP